MNLVQRYILRKLLGAFVIAFPGLAITIWATQALRQLNLVTDRGQALGVFLEATVLILPSLIMIIAPVTMLLVVIQTLNALNADSELVSLNAAGGTPRLLILPILALAVPVTIVSAASSLYFNPLAARQTNDLIAEVNANVISSLIRPGQFRTIADDVVIQVRAVHPDGTLEDIFVFDRRQPRQPIAYMARGGAIVDSPEGRFLLMRDGLVQRRTADTDTVSVIEFASYAFDLATLESRTGDGGLRPNERSMAYILNPDPSDPIQQANPFRYPAEFHNRVTVPFYVLVLALVPAAFLGSPRSARQGRVALTTGTAVFSALLLGCNLYFGGALENNAFLLPLVYAVPILGIAVPIFVLATGRRLRPPSLRRGRKAGRAGRAVRAT